MAEAYVSAKNRGVWRKWLEKNHAKLTAVHLVFAKKDSGEATVRYAEAVEEALCFGWIDGVLEKIDATHYGIRFTPRKPKSIWSKANVERVERMIEQGLMRPPGLAAVAQGKTTGEYHKAYAVRESVDEPPELASHKAAQKIFASLSPGQRKMWTRWIASGKQVETRSKRIAIALERIASGRKAGVTTAQAARMKAKTKKK